MEGDALNLAESALGRYGLAGARAEPLESKKGDKLLFRVDAPTPRRRLLRGLLFRADPPAPDRFLLRVHEKRTVGEAGLRSEMLWLRDLRQESGLLVPEPVPTARGSLVGRAGAAGSPGPRLCVLTRWVPGTIKTSELVPEDVASAGAVVARLHRHSEIHGAPEGLVRPYAYDWGRVFGEGSPLWNGCGVAYSGEDLEVLRAAAGRVLGALQALGEERSVFGVVHSDPTPNNFVFEGGEARLIDFASCGWGHYLHDVAVALSALEAYGERRAALRAAFVGGYRSERPLPEGHTEHLGAFRTMRLARRMARVLGQGDSAARGWGKERFSGAMKRIEAYVAGDGSLERMDLG